MIDKFACILIFFALLIVLIMYFQYTNFKKIEHFSSNIGEDSNTLFIKKTNIFNKILKTNNLQYGALHKSMTILQYVIMRQNLLRHRLFWQL